MDGLIQLTQNMTASTLLSCVACIAGIITAISGVSIKIYKMAQKWRKFENQKEEHLEILEKNQEKIVVLENKIDTLIQSFAKYSEEDVSLIDNLCKKHDVPFELMSKLMIAVDNSKVYTRSSVTSKSVERVLNEGWLHFESIREGLENEDQDD